MNGGDDIGQLIQMQSGSPPLASGQSPILPVGNEPTTTEQIVKNTGVPDKSSSAPQPALNTVQQQNANVLAGLANTGVPAQSTSAAPVARNLPAMQAGPSALTVTQTGHAGPSGQSFGTTTHSTVATGQLSVVATSPQPAAQQYVPTPTAPQQGVDEWEEVADFEIDGEWVEEEIQPQELIASGHVTPSSTPPEQQPAVVQQKPAQPTPDPVASIIAITQPQPPASPPAGEKKFQGDEELLTIVQVQKWIEAQVTQAMLDSGLLVLSDPKHRQQGSYLHDVVWRIKWAAPTLIQQTPHDLLSMEAVLTGHQVWVQGQENYWTMWFNYYGREIDRLMIHKRGNYSGDTKAESENKLLAAEPEVRKMRNQYLLCQAMSTLYKGMGERFAQLEDGIKRTITFVVNEFERQKIQQKYT